ncbi:MAG TPA: aspartate--tRNA(Asn) ligase [Tepidisphaeraceae bacterium]
MSAARILSSQLPELAGKPVLLQGWVHRLRDLGGVRFLLLRDRSGIAQVILPKSLDINSIGSESVVSVHGTAQPEPRAPGGIEVLAERIEVLAEAENPPIDIFKPLKAEQTRLETLLDHRAVSLRMPEVLEIFKIQAEIVRAFRESLITMGFTEIHTPKLVLAGAEGGGALFEVKYYEGKAYLAQSPQFYKQMMVGSGLERVFEIGHAYRAEKSETSRHLTEFVSLDLEMGFIHSEQDVMRVLNQVIAAIFESVRTRFSKPLPVVGVIPQISYPEARQLLTERFNKTEGLEGDLDTEGERLIGQWAKEQHGSELIFITGYALSRRPAYTMPHPTDPALSASFDLLYSGVEIVTGGQRIHRYQQLVERLQSRGFNPAACEGYLEAFRHGMPPHGGMGLGLERLTKQMLGLANVKEACLFPRDRNRLTP